MTPGEEGTSGVRGEREALFTHAELERATDAPTLLGNHIALQFEGPLTFERWIEAIDGARQFVFFEN
ncbi:MAG: hypothetical protein OEZ37_09775, partial [Gemmatimonadota bacterium]|nr:hypothetical protein [Gemmatimonadota bacterium]